MQKLIDGLSVWIKEKVNDAGKKGVAIGLSGGLDSTVAMLLCKNAIGNKNVLGLIMPCHSQPQDAKDAEFIAEFFDIPIKHVELDPIYTDFLSILPWGGELAHGNLKARLRMITLYCFANVLNYLVIGTSNKSELLIGYFTKYGDGGADILPLADIYKTKVKQLAQYMNVPKRILDKTPSAGLWEGQTDKKEIGMTYEKLDKILMNLVEKHKSPETVQEKLINNMIEKTVHKRLLPPICKIEGLK